MAQDTPEQNPPRPAGGRRMRQLPRILPSRATVSPAEEAAPADAVEHVNIEIDQEQSANAAPPLPRPSGGLASTRVHRNAQRMSALGQVVSASVGAFSPAAELPIIAAQTIISLGSALFSHGMKKPERIIQIIQGIFSAARMGLTIAMIAEDEDCDDNKLPICKAALITYLLFAGVLTVSASIAESNKSEEAPSPTA